MSPRPHRARRAISRCRCLPQALRERSWGRRRARSLGLIVFAASLLLGVGGIDALPGVASGASFQVGDLFLSTSSGVAEYSPGGQLVQTVADTSGATDLCFDPSSGDLILPGVGLFDSSGNLVPSNWTAVTTAQLTGQPNCVADGLGHVYIGGYSVATTTETISKYDLDGDLLQTFNVASDGGYPAPSIDLAPDRCTIYYVEPIGDEINRFNVCTNTQEPTFVSSAIATPDAVLVLPNSQVLLLLDAFARLYDPAGQIIRGYDPGIPISNSLRSMSLDPDGTSFWMIGLYEGSSPPAVGLVQYRIDSGYGLAEFPEVTGGPRSIAVYGGSAPPPPPPPLPPPTPPTTTGRTPPPTTPTRGTPPPTNVGPGSYGSAPSVNQIKSLISATLPRGKTATIEALLSNGGYSFSWSAPSAGRLVISWYDLPAGAHISRHSTPILVATVSRNFSQAKSVKLTITLTRRGRQVLKTARRMHLTAKGSFASRGKSATTVIKTFTLTR